MRTTAWKVIEHVREKFSCRDCEGDAQRVRAIAEAHDWPMAKTIQKLVVAALDAKVLK